MAQPHNATDAAMLQVMVVYGCSGQPDLVSVSLPTGSTVREAIIASGLLIRHPEIQLEQCRTGIYGKLKALDTLLREQDRVEIYTALLADPKTARRERANAARRERGVSVSHMRERSQGKKT